MRVSSNGFVFASLVGATTSLLSLLAPASASADTCPAPTAAQCLDAAFYDTTCGQAQMSADSQCASIVRNAYQSQVDALPTVQRAVPGTNQMVSTHVDAADQSLLSYQRRDPANPDQQQPVGALLPFNTYTNWLTRAKLMVLQAGSFTPFDSTPKVGSCEEYVYKAAYEYSVFDSAIARFGSDYRAIFEYTFGPDGIAARPLRDSNGEFFGWPQLPADSAHPLPKNAFFSARDYYASRDGMYGQIGLDGYDPSDQGNASFALSQLDSGAHFWPAMQWSWHQNMDYTLRNTPDEVLYQFDAKKEAFLELLRQREAAFQAAKNETTPTTGCGLFCVRPSTARLIHLDQQIMAALNEAKADGCLSSTVNACDWSPRLFVKTLQGEAASKREADYQSCLAITGNKLALAGATSTDQSTPKKFRTFLANKAAADAVNYPKDPSTGKAKMGKVSKDAGKFGNDDINARWSYLGGWEVMNYGGTKRLCDAQIDVKGNFNIKAHAYGTDVELFDTTAHAWTGTDDTSANHLDGGHGDGTAKAHIYLGVRIKGEQLFTPINGSVPTSIHYKLVDHPNKSIDYTFPGPRVGIGPFTIGIDLGFSAEIGLRYGLDLFAGLGCNTASSNTSVVIASANGNITPYVDANVFGSIDVDAIVADAGVKASLLLVQASLPFDASATLRMTGSVNSNLSVLADASTSLKLAMRTLDGSISVFASVWYLLGTKHWEKEIFSWDGYKTDTTLFNFARNSVSLATLKANL